MSMHLMHVHIMCVHARLRPVSGDAVVAQWRELLARHATAWAALERELGEKHGLGPSEFEALDHMVEAGQERYRVQELAEAVHLSQSALSRLIARMEKQGLVRRTLCEYDRRGVFVHLTEEGRRRHAEALPTHRAVLADVLSRPAPRGRADRPAPPA